MIAAESLIPDGESVMSNTVRSTAPVRKMAASRGSRKSLKPELIFEPDESVQETEQDESI